MQKYYDSANPPSGKISGVGQAIVLCGLPIPPPNEPPARRQPLNPLLPLLRQLHQQHKPATHGQNQPSSSPRFLRVLCVSALRFLVEVLLAARCSVGQTSCSAADVLVGLWPRIGNSRLVFWYFGH
jgi:hypothetical protein